VYGSHLCNQGANVNYVIRPLELPGDPELPAGYSLAQSRGSLGLFRRSGGCEPLVPPPSRYLEGASGMGLHLQEATESSEGVLDVHLVEDGAAFVSGWGNGEIIDCAPARWAVAKQARVGFTLHPAGKVYAFAASLRAFEGLDSQRVQVELNGQMVFEGGVGRDYTLARAAIEPGVLREGRNELVFSFERLGRPLGDDRRELAALFNQIRLGPLVDDFTIEIGAEGYRGHLLSGFNEEEVEGQRSFVWNEGPVSELVGVLVHPSGTYLLQTFAQAIPLLPSQTTRVLVNDQLVGTIAFTPEWARRGLLVPGSVLTNGDNRVRFEYEATARPAMLVKGSTDVRELSVRFRAVNLLPVPVADEIDVGTGEAHRFLLQGWAEDEVEGARSVVWTLGDEASLALRPSRGGRLLVSARACPAAAPVQVQVRLDGHVLGSFSVTPSWGQFEVPMPALKADDGVGVLTLLLRRTPQPPNSVSGLRDARELGLRVDRLRVEAASN
jgi:hypothetical protein